MSTRGLHRDAQVLARRALHEAVQQARDAGVTHYGITEAVVCGHRGLDLTGSDERRLTAILAGIWADADDQRAPYSWAHPADVADLDDEWRR